MYTYYYLIGSVYIGRVKKYVKFTIHTSGTEILHFYSCCLPDQRTHSSPGCRFYLSARYVAPLACSCVATPVCELPRPPGCCTSCCTSVSMTTTRYSSARAYCVPHPPLYTGTTQPTKHALSRNNVTIAPNCVYEFKSVRYLPYL